MISYVYIDDSTDAHIVISCAIEHEKARLNQKPLQLPQLIEKEMQVSFSFVEEEPAITRQEKKREKEEPNKTQT